MFLNEKNFLNQMFMVVIFSVQLWKVRYHGFCIKVYMVNDVKITCIEILNKIVTLCRKYMEVLVLVVLMVLMVLERVDQYDTSSILSRNVDRQINEKSQIHLKRNEISTYSSQISFTSRAESTICDHTALQQQSIKIKTDFSQY